VTPAALGLAPVYQNGNFFTGNGNGASAIVLTNGSDYIVAFRGTDGADDIARYPELFTGAYINHFAPLLSALAAQVPADASPNIATNNGILNIGFDNDPVYKAINLY
jgi:hypothetical protein